MAQLVPCIMKGCRVYFTRNKLWEALWSIGILALYPIFPIAYHLIGKLFMAKVMFSNNGCAGCGRCAKFCPNQDFCLFNINALLSPLSSTRE